MSAGSSTSPSRRADRRVGSPVRRRTAAPRPPRGERGPSADGGRSGDRDRPGVRHGRPGGPAGRVVLADLDGVGAGRQLDGEGEYGANTWPSSWWRSRWRPRRRLRPARATARWPRTPRRPRRPSTGDVDVAPSAGTSICTSWRTSRGSALVTGASQVTAPHSSPAGSPAIVRSTPAASSPSASVAVQTSCWTMVAAPSDPIDAVRASSLRSTVSVPPDRRHTEHLCAGVPRGGVVGVGPARRSSARPPPAPGRPRSPRALAGEADPGPGVDEVVDGDVHGGRRRGGRRRRLLGRRRRRGRGGRGEWASGCPGRRRCTPRGRWRPSRPRGRAVLHGWWTW